MAQSREDDVGELMRLRVENAELKRRLEESSLDASLCESEARYRSVVGCMSEGVVVQDASGAILASNAAAEQILGLSADQLRGRSSLDPRWHCVHEDGSPFLGPEHPAMVTLRTGQGSRNVIMGVHKPDGVLSWIAINTEPVPRAEAKQAAVVCTFTDVTAYREAMNELRESERRARLALEAARMGTWQYDLASRVIRWSARVDEIFGLKKGEFTGTMDAYALCIHPDDRASMHATLMSVLAHDARADSFHALHRTNTADERWVECYGRVTRDATGKVLHMAGTVVDITDQRRIEQQLVRGQRLEAVGRLAGGIAHDFNNVLTAIVGAADLCLIAPKHLKEHVGLIQASAARAARLVQQLLMFSKRQAVERKVLDLGRVVLELEGLLRRLAGERVDLTFDISREVQRIHADQGQLEQVLMNLVANARDALPRGGQIRVTVESLPQSGGNVVSLRVQDDGIGMSRDVVEHAFDPFFTTKEAGTGLGLATCYGIIEQLGGTITLDSAEGKGTTVHVTLPRSHAELSRLSPVAKTPSRKGSETILLVDDDPMVRGVARELLESSGYFVLCAEGAEQALATARAHDRVIDLLLTDVAMPQMSGIELSVAARRLRPTLRVLLMSGYSGDAFARDEAEAARALPLLAKPFTRKDLLDRVREVLDGKSSHSAARDLTHP